MAEAGVPYLIAVPPRVSRRPLDPETRDWRPLDDGERAMLEELRADPIVAFGLHGRDHRTRHVSPRRHSELCGLSLDATEELLDGALAELRERGSTPGSSSRPTTASTRASTSRWHGASRWWAAAQSRCR